MITPRSIADTLGSSRTTACCTRADCSADATRKAMTWNFGAPSNTPAGKTTKKFGCIRRHSTLRKLPTTAFTGSSNVALGLASFPSAQSGNYVNTFTLTAAAFNSLLVGSQAGKAYLNIHSAAYPGGEIRGFLVPVPEPETYALMMAGLGLVGLAARRRRAA